MDKQLTLADRETREELIGVLTAISVVSKQLARKLAKLAEPETPCPETQQS